MEDKRYFPQSDFPLPLPPMFPNLLYFPLNIPIERLYRFPSLDKKIFEAIFWNVSEAQVKSEIHF